MADRPSLGQKLQKVLEQNYGRPSVENTEHFKREKKVIEDFYTDLKSDIIHDIESGMPPRSVKLSASGQHHDVFWIFNMPQRKPVALDRPDNAFRSMWDDFLIWLADNDLKSELFYRKDAKVVHDYWFELRISPNI